MVFADRTDAGVRLASELKGRGYERPLVLALPRGGVPVAYEVAHSLECPLDTLVVRKVGAPLNPEFAVGALAPHDILLLDEASIRSAGTSRTAVDGIVAKEREELRRRVDVYRSGSYSAGYVPKTVIIVDDGIATGMSAKAASMSARKKFPGAHLVFAAPVCLAGAQQQLRRVIDELVCLEQPKQLYAIGQAYEDFPQVSDAEVVGFLGGDPPRIRM